MLLSESRITATNEININIWGSRMFRASFPKQIDFNGTIESESNSVMVALSYTGKDGVLYGSAVKGHIVGNTIRLGSKGVKGQVTNNYDGEPLELVVLDRQGKVIHRQPFNKAVKVKDHGHTK